MVTHKKFPLHETFFRLCVLPAVCLVRLVCASVAVAMHLREKINSGRDTDGNVFGEGDHVTEGLMCSRAS